MTKQQAILAVINLNSSQNDPYTQLAKFPSTSDFSPIKVTQSHLVAVLKQYCDQHISCEQLEFWASFIEMYNDIDHSEIEGELYALANPELMGGINQTKISQLINILV